MIDIEKTKRSIEEINEKINTANKLIKELEKSSDLISKSNSELTESLNVYKESFEDIEEFLKRELNDQKSSQSKFQETLENKVVELEGNLISSQSKFQKTLESKVVELEGKLRSYQTKFQNDLDNKTSELEGKLKSNHRDQIKNQLEITEKEHLFLSEALALLTQFNETALAKLLDGMKSQEDKFESALAQVDKKATIISDNQNHMANEIKKLKNDNEVIIKYNKANLAFSIISFIGLIVIIILSLVK